MTERIWCLFCRHNRYDADPNVLIGWWFNKPDLTTLAKALGKKFPGADDAETLAIVKIWEAEPVPVRFEDADYHLSVVREGPLVPT